MVRNQTQCDLHTWNQTHDIGRRRSLGDGGSRRFLEVSESSSCVEVLNSSSKSTIRREPEVLRDVKPENDDDVSITVCGIENSEVTTRSECSIFLVVLADGRDKLQGNEELDVSVSSQLASPRATSGMSSHFNISDTTVNEGQSAYTEAKDYAVSVASRLESQAELTFGNITSYIDKSDTNKTVNDGQAENCGESKLISADFASIWLPNFLHINTTMYCLGRHCVVF